jgi:glycosyltransferase involved in cell wall biosynthesis
MAGPNTPLRVFHITGCLEIGGQEKLLVEFARHADRRRFALHFISLGSRGALARDLEAEGWPVTALVVPPGFWPRLVPRLARRFRGQADVVHTHNERPLIYAAPAAWLAGVPRVIHTRHGRGTHISRRQRWLANLAARAVDRYVCISDDTASLTISQGVPASRVQTLHNGIDTKRFAYTGPCVDGPALVVARLSPEKDIATLLRAAAIIVRVQPRFKLAVAGDGPCMLELSSLAAELHLTKHVEFLGMVHDVPALLERASLFVLASISEGVSLTLLEAMARGLPVVATRVGGTPEVVTRETGVLVPPRAPEALAAAMLRLVENPVRAERLGAAGRKRVEQCFDIRRMVADYERLYVGEARTTITEDRHDAVDDSPDGGARRRSGRGGLPMAAATRD